MATTAALKRAHLDKVWRQCQKPTPPTSLLEALCAQRDQALNLVAGGGLAEIAANRRQTKQAEYGDAQTLTQEAVVELWQELVDLFGVVADHIQKQIGSAPADLDVKNAMMDLLQPAYSSQLDFTGMRLPRVNVQIATQTW